MPTKITPTHNGTQSIGKKLSIAERRSKVLALSSLGYSSRELASQFDVSHSTILKDVKALVADFIASANVEEYVLRELTLLQRLRQQRWEGAMNGNPDDVDTVLKTHDRISRLMGLAKQPEGAKQLNGGLPGAPPVAIQLVLTDDPTQKDDVITIDQAE